ncbi:MAG: hypothetical protein SFY81_16425, partial [Verrucomicrobiota bacterium]|nr:hypothetical protein [Verrucomicrobiota bacterium]
SPFFAHLVKLGGATYLDLYPEDDPLEELKMGGLYESALILGHLFLKVSVHASELKVATLDSDWLEKKLAENPAFVPHRRGAEKRLILTGTTEEMQKFLTTIEAIPGAWPEPTSLKRAK